MGFRPVPPVWKLPTNIIFRQTRFLALFRRSSKQILKIKIYPTGRTSIFICQHCHFYSFVKIPFFRIRVLSLSFDLFEVLQRNSHTLELHFRVWYCCYNNSPVCWSFNGFFYRLFQKNKILKEGKLSFFSSIF